MWLIKDSLGAARIFSLQVQSPFSQKIMGHKEMEGRSQRTLSTPGHLPRAHPHTASARKLRAQASLGDAPLSKAAGQWRQEATCKHLRKESGDIFVLATESQAET